MVRNQAKLDQDLSTAQAKVWANTGPALFTFMILLALPLAMYIYILYAQVLSILMIQKALEEKEMNKTTKSNLKKVYASNVMILIIEGTSTLILGILFASLLIAFFMSL